MLSTASLSLGGTTFKYVVMAALWFDDHLPSHVAYFSAVLLKCLFYCCWRWKLEWISTLLYRCVDWHFYCGSPFACHWRLDPLWLYCNALYVTFQLIYRKVHNCEEKLSSWWIYLVPRLYHENFSRFWLCNSCHSWPMHVMWDGHTAQHSFCVVVSFLGWGVQL